MCQKCNKDHKKKNEGKLTVCELEQYLKQGSKSSYNRPNDYRYAFGTGNRFQFEGAV